MARFIKLVPNKTYATEANASKEEQMTVLELINLARKHANNGAAMQSSAVLCLKQAEDLEWRKEYDAARMHAIKSLAYSVGVFHPDYKAATAN